MDRDTEELYEAREEIDRRQQRLEGVPLPDREVEAGDPQRAVRVRVGPDGVVRSIVVAHDWKDRIAPAALGEAIAAAYTGAGAERAGAWIEGVEDAFAMPAPRTRPLPMSVEDVMAAIPDADRLTEEQVMGRIAELWREIEAELDGALADLEERTTRVHRASSPDGSVRVALSADGGLEHLELREAWLLRAHPANIGRTVMAVLERAQADAVASFAATRTDADASVARLSTLGDPTRLARRVGLDV